MAEITRITVHGIKTTVYWDDGTKTSVRCKNDIFDGEKGLLWCIAKKYMGSTANVLRAIAEYDKEFVAEFRKNQDNRNQK